jgi:chitodextrinase
MQPRFLRAMLVLALSIASFLAVSEVQAAAPTQGLVGYWKFDEGSGTAVADSSGSNNSGVISGAGATWATGKIGGALSFNGSSGKVTVPGANSINFTGSFTLTAWVRPSALSGYETVVHKGATSACTYWLQTSGARVSGGISSSSTCGTYSEHLASSPSLTVNSWYHLAVVYDSVARTYKVFLNGNSILSQTEATLPAQTSEALVFGQSPCSSCSYERWRGLLDEIRAYNRPLSSQEVLDVFNDVGAAPPDAQAPTVPSALSATAVSSTQVNLSWNASTDNVGVAGYHAYRNGTLISTTTATVLSDLGRTPSTTYSYSVDAFDAAGNVSAASASVAATTLPAMVDGQAPSVSLISPTNGAIVAGQTVTVSATATDNVGVTAVQFLLDGQPLGAPDTTAPFSQTWDTATATGGPHTLSAIASDAAGNQGSAAIVTVTVDNQAPTGTVSINDGASLTNNPTVTLRLSATDTQTAVTQMRFSNTGSSYSTAEAMAATKTWTLSTGSGTKTVYAQFADAAGNWSTAATATIVLDTTSPTLSAVSASGISNSGATVLWVSNEPSTSRVDYGPTTAYGLTTPLDPTLVTNHATVLGGLNSGTLYNYRVRSIDAAGNETVGSNQTFTTTTASDTTPPTVSLTAPGSGAIVAGQTVTVSATATDNVGVTAVQFLFDGQPLGTPATTAPFSRTWDTTTATGGPHTLSAMASDAAGNQGSAAGVSVTVDNQAPTGTVSIDDGASATNSRTVTLRLSATDGQTAVTQMRFSNTGSSYSTAEANAPTKTWTLSSRSGTKTVYVQFADAAGNWSAAATDTIVLDTTSPTLSSISASGISNSGATVLWISNEPSTSRVDYGATTAYGLTTPLDPTLVTNHARVLGGLNPGTGYNYRVRSIDAAGNEALGSNRTFTTTTAPDTTPPTVSLTQPAPATVLSGSVTLAASAADDVGVAGVRFLVDDQQLGAEDVTSPYAVVWDTTGSTNQSHVLSAVARDTSGNQTSSAPVTISVSNFVDSEAPSAPTDVEATTASTSSLVVTWTASTDNVGVAGYRVYREGTLLPSITATQYVDSGLAPLTTYSYTVVAYDAAGNASSPSGPASATTLALEPSSYPLKLSSDRRYIVDQNDRPFFINGDTAWSLIAQLTREDAEIYLENRRQKGFNVVLVNLVEHQFASKAPANIYGDQPFLTLGNFNTPNETYFSHADWVIDRAAEKGLVVLLDPLYLGYGCGSEGWCGEVKSASTATIRSWGRYVGNRYANRPNIVWLIGGDTDPVAAGLATKVREFVAGVRESDTHLMTAHNAPEQAARDPWPNEPWLDLNDIYTYSSTYLKTAANYAAAPGMPLFLVEAAYENEHSSTPSTLRAEAYWTVLSGGTSGHFFGNCQIWAFSQGGCSSSWKAQLDSTGSSTLALVGKLFDSRAFYELLPDTSHTVLTSGYQSGSNYATAARTSSGSTIVAFIPTPRTVTIDMTKVSGTSANAWWYNPRTGLATLAGTFPTVGTRDFTLPDANDWVLVIDDASLVLPPPGS